MGRGVVAGTMAGRSRRQVVLLAKAIEAAGATIINTGIGARDGRLGRISYVGRMARGAHHHHCHVRATCGIHLGHAAAQSALSST